jgi:hypothetical protein
MLNLMKKTGGKILDLIEESRQKEIHLSVLSIVLRNIWISFALYLDDYSTLTAATTRAQEPFSSDPKMLLVANVKIYSTKNDNSYAIVSGLL